jgi:hypothetical protein
MDYLRPRTMQIMYIFLAAALSLGTILLLFQQFRSRNINKRRAGRKREKRRKKDMYDS